MPRPSSLFLCVLAIVSSGCREEAPPPPPVKITIAGSTAAYPLLKDAAARFSAQNKRISVEVAAGGSHVGIDRVSRGDVTLGASDVRVEPPLAHLLEDHTFAVVGYAVMANKGMFDESIRSLTKEEVEGIFTGRYRNWAEVGGDDQPIVVINRAKNSGTRSAFQALALGGKEFVAAADQDSSSDVLKVLLATPGAISYLALSYGDPLLLTFAYEGVAPTRENVENGTYPLWSHEHLYSRGKASEEVVEFLSFLTSGRYSREVFPKLGFIPLKDMRVVRDSI
ncbi:MAG TPA: phosphate ABC transporter substrate-binding protein [Polyangiaceae bacterium]|nr:phosphate ABC transporter substrate-binding protein [Polyangiaceae bacterium]